MQDYQHGWHDVDEAAEYIGHLMARYGRITVSQTKEKWGEARVYIFFGLHSVYTVIYPYRHFIRGWLRFTDRVSLRWLNFIAFPYQKRIYRWAYKKGLEKYPHLRDNILCGADFPEYLEGL